MCRKNRFQDYTAFTDSTSEASFHFLIHQNIFIFQFLVNSQTLRTLIISNTAPKIGLFFNVYIHTEQESLFVFLASSHVSDQNRIRMVPMLIEYL